MYNLRYHIASLVSVFLALALGLVLGGLIVQRGTFDRQTSSLVKGLQKEFTDLRLENRELRDEGARSAGFSSDFVDAWTAGRLDGKTVMVITGPGKSGSLRAVREAVEKAGGTLATVTVVKPGMGVADDSIDSEVASIVPDPENAQGSLAAALASEWTTGSTQRPVTAALVDAGAIGLDGLKDDAVVTGLIDIAAPENKVDPLAVAIAKEFRARLVPAIGAQTPDSESGLAPAAAGLGLASMDTLGTEIGRYTLVALLGGADAGYYGVAQGVEALYPPIVIP